MKNDRFVITMLGLVSVLLLLNLFAFVFYPDRRSMAVAQNRFEPVPSVNPQSVGFRGNGVGVACSSDGKYVYAAGSRTILRSDDYGKAGTWLVVLSE